MILNVTDLAVEKIRAILKKRHAPSIGIRVGVKTTGCSGLAYYLEFINYRENKFDPNDEVLVWPDFVIKISQRDLPYVNGATMDWVKQGLNEGFEFLNPNERDRCGCGESFRV